MSESGKVEVYSVPLPKVRVETLPLGWNIAMHRPPKVTFQTGNPELFGSTVGNGLKPPVLTLKITPPTVRVDSFYFAVEWARSSTMPVYRCLSLPALGDCVAFECHEHAGFHVQEDDFLVECLDSTTLEPVPDGTPGELVITSLRQEATPLVRLRTGKTVVLDRAPCACGRERLRLRF